MLTRNYLKQTLNKRIIIFLVTTVIFIISFVLNIRYSLSAYNLSLKFVPIWQTNSVMGSNGFNIFMNLVSTIFNPMVCAAYVFILYFITYRKLEVIAFLIWFFFLSWLLGILKMAIHQARPYWVEYSGVEMKSWTCFTDFGCPSGHSMLAIVILEFILRFFARVHKCIYNYIGLFYILIFVIQLLVMLSRMMLGMHSLNQVLFGMSIGLFSFIPYYLFLENIIMQLILKIFVENKSMKVNIVCALVTGLFITIQLLLAFVPNYTAGSIYYKYITTLNGCTDIKQYQCFQYNCLIGTSIIVAGSGIIIGLNYMEKPQNLIKMLSYPRLSLKFVGRIVLIIILGAVPILIFVNPLWNNININSNAGAALLLWALSNIAFFLAPFLIVFLTPIIGERFSLQLYTHPQSYSEYKQYQSFDLFEVNQSQFYRQRPRQTELITSVPTQYSKQK